jgi:hypothetical protein
LAKKMVLASKKAKTIQTSDSTLRQRFSMCSAEHRRTLTFLR